MLFIGASRLVEMRINTATQSPLTTNSFLLTLLKFLCLYNCSACLVLKSVLIRVNLDVYPF